MPSKGCTYSRKNGKCISAERHYALTHGSGRKKGCSYGKYSKGKSAGKCMSKKAAGARRSAAAKKLQKAFRRSRK